MKRLLNGLFVLVVIGFCTWLFLNENAAEPGGLSNFHAGSAGCEDCHIAWRGVSSEKCIQCHDFGNRTSLKPLIAFHAAKKYCLKCHREHAGAAADISHMDHTLLNGDLLCTQCHFDKHGGLFGQDCRACHRISTWKIPAYRHPPEGTTECAQCHKAPHSHFEPEFWGRIEKGMGAGSITLQECWICHTTRQWGLRKMGHGLK